MKWGEGLQYLHCKSGEMAAQRKHPQAEEEARQESMCRLLQIKKMQIKEGEGYDAGGKTDYRGVVL